MKKIHAFAYTVGVIHAASNQWIKIFHLNGSHSDSNDMVIWINNGLTIEK